MKNIYFKSFRKGDTSLETSMLDPNTNTTLTCQTLNDILRQRTIKPNTHHHALPTRLSVSCLTPNFPGAYRPEGLLFTTEQSPAYCVPFDLMALTNGKTFTAQDHSSDFLQGYARFMFTDFESMTRTFQTSSHALNALTKFRRDHGLNSLDQRRNYNEVCFENEIKIEPLALVGDSVEIKALCWENQMKRYDSVEEYILAKNYPLKFILEQAKKMFDLALPYMFDGCQGLAQER